ncbi:MAG: GNAT family N-acetyltransferase [Lachnospiraceae bacterium]|jgi:ribosomal protein S18 acetylase RimI-like enzyme|nr:GNAT family N-acetyltransferase [Lachnospiraceae bacterium]
MENLTSEFAKEHGICVRFAEAADIPRIDELLNQVNKVHHDIRPDLFRLGRKYSDEELVAILKDPKRPIFCAADAKTNKLLGYCMTEFQQILGDSIRTEIKTIYIDDLCVDEEARGRHLGQILYDTVKAYGKAHDFYNITLHVWEGNDRAAGFYAAMGMKTQYTCLEERL